MNNWVAFGLNVAGSATVAVLGIPTVLWLLSRWRSWRATRPLKSFWDPLLKRGLTVVTAAEEREPEVKTQIFDFMAASAAEAALNQCSADKGRCSRTDCSNIVHSALVGNLLLIGGPIPNDLTKKAHKNESLRYVFRADDDSATIGKREGNDIIDRRNLNSPRHSDFEGDVVVRDVGIISRVASPLNSASVAIISEGSYGWGTSAAVGALLDPKILKLLEQKAPYPRKFQLLVSVPVYRRIPGKPEVDWSSLVLLD